MMAATKVISQGGNDEKRKMGPDAVERIDSVHARSNADGCEL
jgi:hypothetical protein